MMKKYIKLLLVFTLFLLPNVVFADSSFGGTNRHILTVERLNVVNSKITFEGYSFISHMDNLGIMADDGFKEINGNLQTYLIVYVGDWKDIYGKNTEIDIDTCEKNSNCYIKAATMVPRSFFYSRCTDAGCANYEKIKEHRQRKVNGKINGLLNDTSCHSGENNYDLDGDGNKNEDNECLYENVGFTVTVDISTIVDEFTDGEFYDSYAGTDGHGIKFKIMAYNTTKKKGLASGFNIHSSACHINGNLCSGTDIKTASYEFDLNDFASTVYYDATQAIPTTYNNGIFNNYSGYWFRSQCGENKCSYNIEDDIDGIHSYLYDWQKNDGIEKSKYDTSCGGTDHYCGKYKDAFVLLDTKDIKECAEVDKDNKCYRWYLSPDDTADNDDYYYAPANHLTFGGEFKINVFSILMKKIECNQIVDIGEDDFGDKEMKCGQSRTFNQCKKSGDNGASVSGTIYYYIENAKQKDGSGELSCSYMESLINGKCYLPVTVSADVLIIQEGKFSFEKFTPDIVSAGKGFSFKDSVGGITYENNVSFLIASRYNNSNDPVFYNTPYINFSATKYKLKENANGYVEDLDFNIDEEVRKYYSEYYEPNKSMHEISRFYYYNDKGEFQVGNSLEAASFAIGNSFFASIAKNYDNIAENNKDFSEIFKFESCDSNSSSPDCKKTSVNGSWTEETKLSEWLRLDRNGDSYQRYIKSGGASPYKGVEYRDSTEHRGFGKLVSKVYKYSLPHAYISLTDTDKYKYADVIYSATELNSPEISGLEYIGNKYFVGLKYVYDKANDFDFPFNLIKSDISLVENMTWNLTATCGVEVQNKLYKKPPPQCSKKDCGLESKISYKFRPISLSRPFPKSVAVNWQNWLDNNPGATRLTNTKDWGKKYSIRLSKFDVNDASIVKLSDINSYSLEHGSYADLRDYNPDGSSYFVNKYFPSFKQGTTSYCGLGYFSSNCDQYANSMG